MNKKIPIIPIACLAAATTALALLLFGRDGFIINNGIKAYNAARLAAAVAIAACAAWTVISFRVRAVREKAREKAEHEARLDKMGLGKRSLDESDRNRLYAELEGFAAGKWKGMDGVRRILAQFDSMDEYQAEMGRLLDQDAYLKNKPAEIVQRVEDCMYVNARKLLNYMRIVQVKDPGTMREKTAECEAKNAELLKKTDDFVVAVVAYINGDMAAGEEEKTRSSVDEYMYVVLRAIELPETYLK